MDDVSTFLRQKRLEHQREIEKIDQMLAISDGTLQVRQKKKIWNVSNEKLDAILSIARRRRVAGESYIKSALGSFTAADIQKESGFAISTVRYGLRVLLDRGEIRTYSRDLWSSRLEEAGATERKIYVLTEQGLSKEAKHETWRSADDSPQAGRQDERTARPDQE